jgi:site-specific recombinase XerD
MEYRASMETLAPSTINVRLSAVRKLVAEARRNGLIGVEDAASLSEVPNIRQKGARLGNWLTREQAKELLGVPDRSTLKGKRDYVLLVLLVGCALRRQELATLDVDTIQLREPVATGKANRNSLLQQRMLGFSLAGIGVA